MQLDLNLLIALDALLEEGSVTAAASRLHVSVPAMSRTLGRIRRATGDQILVRTGRTMTPTPRALALRASVHDLVQQAHRLLSPHTEVDPASLARTFILKWHDALAAAAGPVLQRSTRAEAPGTRLRFLAEASNDIQDPRRGDIDLEAGSSKPSTPEIRHEIVGHDRLILALRPDHPLAQGQMTLADYAAAEHITVSRRGRLWDPVDDELKAHGLSRQIVAAAPTNATALQFISHNDLLVAVPEAVSRPDLDALGLHTRPLPLAMPDIPIYLAWHQRYDNDPAHAWLREHARTALRRACGASASVSGTEELPPHVEAAPPAFPTS
ncbi:LysR family transcriptional regulator [Streptomyces sp. NBC_00233]|uniref:LysR family transcriptional regulator n=1 Tax=Streptomyces sp. NBC_00233 TaxID=2975686 RepID=UPI0022562A68|nr:LysR family transcriptional regulator [Streptomyces sp. NBC_00233]MCX5231272.1 LysR family transcriptional regulator [Streptomyces sp. NBC_00233]